MVEEEVDHLASIRQHGQDLQAKTRVRVRVRVRVLGIDTRVRAEVP